MRYTEFEFMMSPARMSRYLVACGGDTRKAMTLYRINLRLSQEMFTVISCFEVGLRNAVDRHYQSRLGTHWLRDAAMRGGIFDQPSCRKTARLIQKSMVELGPIYTHSKLVATFDFGFWRYLFAQPAYTAGGRTLLQIFPAKPKSTASMQYNQSFVFNQLASINELRNRIAHHEPICFLPGLPVKDTTLARQQHGLVLQLFQWMSVDAPALLYGLDHIHRVCWEIDSL